MSETNVEASGAGPAPARRYAGFWVRALASLVDDIIVMTASLALTIFGLYVVYQATKPAATFSEAFTGGFIQTVNLAAMTFVSVPYYIGFHWRFGWTPGKRIFGIRVIREIDDGSLSLGRSSARYFAQLLSAIPFGAGYLMAAMNPKKKALHDAIAGTVSILE
ncbi:MAG: RDD family protein [Bdellovibrionales bacterium]|nr:RDD family protein [Bdellovibrionales bacterium]